MNRFSIVNRKAWPACFVDDVRRVALEVDNKVFLLRTGRIYRVALREPEIIHPNG